MNDRQADPNSGIAVQDFDSRFAWRRTRHIHNWQELAQIPGSVSEDPLTTLPRLLHPSAGNDAAVALRHSILYLICEATECFVFGEFQSCILTCGAVIERVLKAEYEAVHGNLPKGTWTLGRCIHNLDWTSTRITDEVLRLADEMVEPRNNRVHALLEHTHPQIAISGGPNRGVEWRSARYLIEPYRGDAKSVIEITYKILTQLYGVQPPAPGP